MSNIALIVGIDDYSNTPLRGCVNDARSLAELLSTNEDGSPNFEVRLFKNEQKKTRLTSMIKDLFSRKATTALLYFSGHGCVNELGGYIVTPDAMLYDEGIQMDNILRMANMSKCTNRIIILDCCYSGVFGYPTLAGGVSPYISEGVTILTACDRNEIAMEENGHGVFTNLLLEALRGAAANINGQVTPHSVYTYIDQSLGAFEQRPVFRTNITRSVTLREILPQVPKELLRNICHYFPKPDHVYPLDPSYEDTNTIESRSGAVLPYADSEKVTIFKELQQLQRVGLVEPIGTAYLFFAAMESKACRLTALGRHYWRLSRKGMIH